MDQKAGCKVCRMVEDQIQWKFIECLTKIKCQCQTTPWIQYILISVFWKCIKFEHDFFILIPTTVLAERMSESKNYLWLVILRRNWFFTWFPATIKVNMTRLFCANSLTHFFCLYYSYIAKYYNDAQMTISLLHMYISI